MELFKKIKKIFFVKRDLKPIEKLKIFLFKTRYFMFYLLILYVFDHFINMRMRVGEHAVPLLPSEFTLHPSFAVDEFICLDFYLLNKIRDQDIGFKSHKQMCMVWHGMNS